MPISGLKIIEVSKTFDTGSLPAAGGDSCRDYHKLLMQPQKMRIPRIPVNDHWEEFTRVIRNCLAFRDKFSCFELRDPYFAYPPIRVFRLTCSIAVQKPFLAHHWFLPMDFCEFLSPPQLHNETNPEEPFLLHNQLNQYLQVFSKTDWWPKKNLSKV